MYSACLFEMIGEEEAVAIALGQSKLTSYFGNSDAIATDCVSYRSPIVNCSMCTTPILVGLSLSVPP